MGFAWEFHPILPKDKRHFLYFLLLLCVFPVERTIGNVSRICFQNPSSKGSCDWFRKKTPSLDSFSLSRLCLFSVLIAEIKIYAFLISLRKEKEVGPFKPSKANYAFSNIMQFWPLVTYLLKRLLIRLLGYYLFFF